MAQIDTSPQESAKAAKKTPSVRPLTRRDYKRTEVTQQQISTAMTLSAAELITRAQQRDETAPNHLSAEALVYFIRQSDGARDRKTRDALIRELLERCNIFFRSQFPRCSKEDREELQSTVITTLVEDLLDTGDRGDFMQVRFWLYLKRKSINARKEARRHSGDNESLDSAFSSEAEAEGRTKLDMLADKRLGPEDMAMLAEGLVALQPRLRKVFLLRHYVGMNIGADKPADESQHGLTLAQQFNCSGRTIRNWLKEAEALLAPFREK